MQMAPKSRNQLNMPAKKLADARGGPLRECIIEEKGGSLGQICIFMNEGAGWHIETELVRSSADLEVACYRTCQLGDL